MKAERRRLWPSAPGRLYHGFYGPFRVKPVDHNQGADEGAANPRPSGLGELAPS